MSEYPNDTPPQSPNVLGIPIELVFAVFALFVSVNLIYLDIMVFGQLKKSTEGTSITTTQPPTATTQGSCPQSCITKMQELITTSPPATPDTTVLKTPTPTTVTPTTIREFFIPFGAGSGSNTDWADIPGLAASINTSNYAKLKTVTFEATLRIPTGNQSVSVRLYNATDKHPVWFSDVATEGGTTTLVTSPAITLDPGEKTYQVQLKTSLGYPAFIDQSRLRIITR